MCGSNQKQSTMNYWTVNGGGLFGQKCATLHYARCNRSCVAHVVPQECTMKVQEGKFKLQDLLVVPMQRVLKYHLLLKARACSPLKPPFTAQSQQVQEDRPIIIVPCPGFPVTATGAQITSLPNRVNNARFIQSSATFASFLVIVNALYECTTSGLYWWEGQPVTNHRHQPCLGLIKTVECGHCNIPHD